MVDLHLSVRSNVVL